MSSAKMEKSKKKPKGSALKITFKTGQHHVCGICRREHASKLDAHNCLKACLESSAGNGPVKKRGIGAKSRFHCAICAREYAHHDEAQACQHECQASLVAKKIGA